jgi:hypothetical protein
MLSDLNKVSGSIRSLKEDLNKRVREAATNEMRPALKSALMELKEKVPQISKLYWTQYTPHFNDGDECIFHMNEVYFFVRGIPAVSEDYVRKYGNQDVDSLHPEERHDTFSVWRFDAAQIEKDIKENRYCDYGIKKFIKDNILTMEQAQYVGEFATALKGLEEAFHVAFGDHAQITVNVDSGEIEVDSYDHD